MASLLDLMNRAITYFKESKSATGGTNSEVSTDDKSNSSVDRLSIDEIIPCEDAPKHPCHICTRSVRIDRYNYERGRCNYCCSLMEEGEKQCVECKELKHHIISIPIR
jgi:hypothetical protein